MPSIADRLGGFGAGLQGRLPEFREGVRRRQVDAQNQQNFETQAEVESNQRLSKEREDAMLSDAFRVRSFLKGNNLGAATRLLQNRVQNITQLGGDDSDTRRLLEQISSGDVAGAFQEVDTLVDFAMRSGRLTPEGGIPDTAEQRNFKALTEGLSPEDLERAKRIKLKLDPGATNQRSIEEEFLLARLRGEGTARGKGDELRRADTIDAGIGAAKGIPVLRRSLDLLEEIRTSGFDNAVLNAKRLFGVEGADEGELSANLGRAVLSQLRPIFGAQFTQKEGERLERIEAGFGKSVESNRRLIRQLLVVAEDAAKRAKRADPNERELDKIDGFLSGEFDISDERLQQVFKPRQQDGAPQSRAVQQQPLSTNTSQGIKFLGFE